MNPRIFTLASTGAFLLIAAFLFGIGVADTPWLSGVIDSLAPDGRATQYTLERIAGIQQRLLPAALLYLALGIAFAIPRLRLGEHLLGHLAAMAGSLRSSRQRVARFVREEPLHASAVAGITVFSLASALALLAQPMRCDEAATYLEYVSKPFLLIVTSYQSTNNHILHSLLSRVATLLLGDDTWVIRLPALVAGLLCVPATYAAVRSYFDRNTALLATGMVGSWLWLVDLSTTARGYSLINLIFLLLLVVVPRLLDGRRGGWGLLVLLSVLGVYNIPIMVYPLTAIYGWLAVSALLERPFGDAVRFLQKVSAAGVVSVLITLLLYSWTLLASGGENVVMSRWVQPQIISYLDSLRWVGMLLARMFEQWRFGWPSWLAWGSLVLFAAALLLSWRHHARGHRMLVTNLLAVFAIPLAMGRAPFYWTVPYLTLPFLIGVAAGFVALADLALRERVAIRHAAVVTALVLLCSINLRLLLEHRDDLEFPWYVGYHDAPEAAAYLAPLLEGQGGVAVAGNGVHMRPVQFYLDREGVGDVRMIVNTDWLDGETVLYFLDIEDPEHDPKPLLEELESWGFERTTVEAFPRSKILRLERGADGSPS